MKRPMPPVFLLVLLPFLAGCGTPTPPAAPTTPAVLRESAIRKDPVPEFPGEGWIGYAISYSGFRENQEPDGEQPSKSQVKEDMEILAPHWSFIRTYSASQHSEDVLEVIRENQLPIRVMLGAWLTTEDPGHWDYKEGNAQRNDQEVEAAIRLANQYPDIVVAINVGNEILVDWSFQPVSLNRVIKLVKRVQTEVEVPVTVADNYVPWTEDRGKLLAEIVDFVTVHTYPLWEKTSVEDAMALTEKTIKAVRESVGADKRIVIGEAGWATYTPEDPEFHVSGAGSEANQALYFQQLHDWAIREGIPVFWFEAFDEPWKGDGTEGYWGIYDVKRQPKAVLQEVSPK